MNIRSLGLQKRFAGLLAVCFVCIATPAAAHHHHRDQPTDNIPGEFDYYLLSLSWSPTYCLTHADDRGQCGGKGFGFVLHGLWAQNDGGGYPQNCQTEALLDPPAEAVGRTLYPSPQLMQHEWQRHGSCSGLSALHYFQTADRAVAVVKIPPAFEAPVTDITMTKSQILGAFRDANPALPSHAMTVACSGRRFSEVRLCLTRDLQPRPCGRGVRDSCPAVPLQVSAAR